MTETNIWTQYRELVPKNCEPENAITKRMHRQIVEQYVYLTKRVVGKMKKSMPAHVDKDDLESLAKIGLMQAVLRFDNTLAVPFEAFTTQRMRSVIMDGIREADWAPRSLRKKERDIKQAEESLRQKLKREPTPTEVADVLDITEADISETKYKAEISTHTYINTLTSTERGSSNTVEPPLAAPELTESERDIVDLMRSTLSKTLINLPDRQAAIIAMHYYGETKLSDIAKLLRVSEVKIGTIHAEAVTTIWQKMTDALNEQS